MPAAGVEFVGVEFAAAPSVEAAAGGAVGAAGVGVGVGALAALSPPEEEPLDAPPDAGFCAAKRTSRRLKPARTRAATPGAVVKEMSASSPRCSASTRARPRPAGASVLMADASVPGMRTKNFSPSANVR